MSQLTLSEVELQKRINSFLDRKLGSRDTSVAPQRGNSDTNRPAWRQYAL